MDFKKVRLYACIKTHSYFDGACEFWNGERLARNLFTLQCFFICEDNLSTIRFKISSLHYPKTITNCKRVTHCLKTLSAFTFLVFRSTDDFGTDRTWVKFYKEFLQATCPPNWSILSQFTYLTNYPPLSRITYGGSSPVTLSKMSSETEHRFIYYRWMPCSKTPTPHISNWQRFGIFPFPRSNFLFSYQTLQTSVTEYWLFSTFGLNGAQNTIIHL